MFLAELSNQDKEAGTDILYTHRAARESGIKIKEREARVKSLSRHLARHDLFLLPCILCVRVSRSRTRITLPWALTPVCLDLSLSLDLRLCSSYTPLNKFTSSLSALFSFFPHPSIYVLSLSVWPPLLQLLTILVLHNLSPRLFVCFCMKFRLLVGLLSARAVISPLVSLLFIPCFHFLSSCRVRMSHCASSCFLYPLTSCVITQGPALCSILCTGSFKSCSFVSSGSWRIFTFLLGCLLSLPRMQHVC